MSLTVTHCLLNLCTEPVFNHCTVELLFRVVPGSCTDGQRWVDMLLSQVPLHMIKSTLHPSGCSFKYTLYMGQLLDDFCLGLVIYSKTH